MDKDGVKSFFFFSDFWSPELEGVNSLLLLRGYLRNAKDDLYAKDTLSALALKTNALKIIYVCV